MGERTIRANGIDTAVVEAGGGDQHLLVLHGFTGSKADFAPWAARLAGAGWHTVVPDLRGHGDSAKPDDAAAYSLRHYVTDVLALADALGWDRMVVLGHSMGGMIAQLVALEVPDRVDGLILMGTSHGIPDHIPPDVVDLGRATVQEQGMEGLVSVTTEAPDLDPFTTPAWKRLVEIEPWQKERSDGNTLAASPVMWLAMADDLLSQPDRLSRLATLDVPTLVIAGEQDRPFLEQCRRMGGTIPKARYVEVADAGHNLQFEAPEAWWSAVGDFLHLASQRRART